MTDRQRTILRFAAAWALPLAVWLIATGWFGFDLGKYSDDWAVSLRVPETDAYHWPLSPFIRWNYFWRPLHLLTVYSLATAFWHHDWVNHLFSAACHLGVALLIYRLLRRLSITAAAARLAITVFLALPISIEAVLWPAALGSVVGVGWLLMLALMCVRRARADEPLVDAFRLKWFATLAVMGFLTACWHEQPGAGVLAIPLLSIAAAGASIATLRRGIADALAAGAGVLLYVVLFVATVPPTRRGGTNTLTGLAAISDRLHRLTHMSWDLSLGPRARDTTIDALHIGWSEAAHAGAFWIAAPLLVVAALALVVHTRRPPPAREPHAAFAPRRAWIILFAAAAGIATLAPIALVTWQPMHPRYLYGLGMAAAIALAACLDPIFAARPARVPIIRLAASTSLVACSLVFAIACVGWQVQFRARSRADVDQAAQLKRLVPSPPPNAVFVPIELADARAPSLRPRDPGVLGALAQPWSCWAYVQRAYGRSDLSATHLRPGQKPPISATDAGIVYPRGVSDAGGRTDAARTTIEWSSVIPFTVDSHGLVRLLSREEARQRLGASAVPPPAK